MDLAPLCVPIMICRADVTSISLAAETQRCFRLALELSVDRVRLRSPLPSELCGPPLRIRLHLPPPTEQSTALEKDWDGALEVYAVAGEEIVEPGSERERAEARLLLFENLLPADRFRIESYITHRLLSGE